MSKKNQPLTDRQREVFNFIRSFRKEKQNSPTLREIGAAMGIKSCNGVMCHLKALTEKGLITRDNHSSRGIMVLVEDDEQESPLQTALGQGFVVVLTQNNAGFFATMSRAGEQLKAHAATFPSILGSIADKLTSKE